MTKAEKTVRALGKELGRGALGSLLLFLYDAVQLQDLQTIEDCHWWANALRTVADAVDADYGNANHRYHRAETPVRREMKDTSEEPQQ